MSNFDILIIGIVFGYMFRFFIDAAGEVLKNAYTEHLKEKGKN